MMSEKRNHSAPHTTDPYTPEYLHTYNGDSLYAVAILFIVLVTVCVTLRFYARRMGNVTWGLDDSLVIPGTVFCLALCTGALGNTVPLAPPKRGPKPNGEADMPT